LEWGSFVGMQEFCHRCGCELPEDSGESPFCPQCGAPQLSLALENQSVETGGEQPSVAISASGEASTGAVPPPNPRRVEWKTAIRCALAVSAVGALLGVASIRVDLLFLPCLLWIMSAPLIALSFYKMRKPAAWIDVRVGARIGVVVGLCTALELCVALAGAGLVARFALHSMAGFDANLTMLFQQVAQRSASSMSPDKLQLLGTPEFRAGIVLFYFAFGSAIVMLFSVLGGAFAGLQRKTR
jgi:hypothetical protein